MLEKAMMTTKVISTLLLTASATLGSPTSDVDSLVLVMNNLANLGNTELNFVSDFMIDDQKKVGTGVIIFKKFKMNATFYFVIAGPGKTGNASACLRYWQAQYP